MLTTEPISKKRSWYMSREEYYLRYSESDKHVELIEGQVYQMTPAGPRHVTAVSRLRRVLEKQIDEDQFVLRQESQIVLPGDSDPEPDITIVCGPDSLYEYRHPDAQEVLLAIEVSETSLSYDQNTKLPLYAAHAIPEVWIVNVVSRHVHIYRHPEPSARRYQDHTMVASGLLPHPVHLPTVSVAFDSIFPSR